MSQESIIHDTVTLGKEVAISKLIHYISFIPAWKCQNVCYLIKQANCKWQDAVIFGGMFSARKVVTLILRENLCGSSIFEITFCTSAS